MVDRDKCLIGALGGEARRQRLRAKNLHNLVTAALFLLSRWMFVFATAMIWELAVLDYPRFGVLSLFAAALVTSWLGVLFFAFVERASLGFRRLQPRIVSIYDPYFWWHERHWKLSDSPIVKLFDGTPFKNMVSRLVGVKIGRKVYDDGCRVTDRTLTEIGDYANLNERSLPAGALARGGRVQVRPHPDGRRAARSARRSFVHYGVTHGRPRRDRGGFLPDEGRGARPAHCLARQSGQALPPQPGRQGRHRSAEGDGRALSLRHCRGIGVGLCSLLDAHLNDVTMPPDVRLKDVTSDNWEAVADLALEDAQKDQVSSNLDSLAEFEAQSLRAPARRLCRPAPRRLSDV